VAIQVVKSTTIIILFALYGYPHSKTHSNYITFGSLWVFIKKHNNYNTFCSFWLPTLQKHTVNIILLDICGYPYCKKHGNYNTVCPLWLSK